ncbi:MAG: TraR/DksA C4-type zinc finger protein [Deltaproteobacteria bacterium]|nr:TraR/DksA C4-type zinc finger protein [Deltaproteobacteria bacterium]
MQPDTLDVAAAYRDREMRLRLLEKKSDLFQEILEALHRMETGSYGTCENCGEEIGLARLRASPTTALCLDCKKEQEQVLRNRELSFRTVSSLPA